MAMTLIVWRGPVVDDAEEAEVLLAEWREEQDDSYFEPSAALAAFADELRAADPGAEARFAVAERLLAVKLADGTALDPVTALARRHGLVMLDTAARRVHLPDEAERSSYAPPLGFAAYAKSFAMLLVAVGVFALGWMMPVPVINWILMLVGGFFTTVILFMLWCFWEGSRLARQDCAKAG